MSKRKVTGPIYFGPKRVPVYSDADGNLIFCPSDMQTVFCEAENCAVLLRQLGATALARAA